MNEDQASGDLVEAPRPDSAALSKTIDLTPAPSTFDFEDADVSQSITPSGQRRIAGRYDILGLLGSGGMGNVYRVRDTALDEEIALKTLRGDLSDSEQALTRFRREVKLARRVTHPNVARTFDIGTDGTLTYLTMEYIEGEPLTIHGKRLAKGSLTQLIELMVQVARGLEAAHEAGVIHRDLKPANIMIASTGRAVITDFGIARASSGHATASMLNTGSAGLVGTPLYMAPEQVEGVEDIDFRADIYAFGCILYELLAGAPPFIADSPVAVAIARLMRPAPRLSTGDYPSALVDLVARALERDPGARHHNVGALAAGLEEILGTLETDAVGRPALKLENTFEDLDDATQVIEHLQHQTQTSLQKTTVAVLPFINRDMDESCYVSECLTEELVGELSMSPTLRVKPASKGHTRGESLTRLGKQLGVDLLVSGSLRRTRDDRLRVRVALTSVEDGFQIWGDKFLGDHQDLFQIAEDAAEAIAEALRAKVTQGRPDALTDPVAIDLYMRARHHAQLNWYNGMEEGIELFRRALERAPDDPRILTGMATTLARQTFFTPEKSVELLTEAAEHAKNAVERAPDWPDPHFALAIVAYNRGDIIGTERCCRAALARHPEHLESLDLLGRVLSEMGPLDESRLHLERAIAINEGLMRAFSDLQRVYALQADWEAYDRLLEARPEIPPTYKRSVEAVDFRLGMWRGEHDVLPLGPDDEQSIKELPTGMFPIARELSIAITNNEPFPVRLLDNLIEMGRMATPGSQQQLLVLQIATEFASYAQLEDQFFDALTTVIDMGLRDLMWLERAPIFDAFRDDPRFQRLVQRVALKYQARALTLA